MASSLAAPPPFQYNRDASASDNYGRFERYLQRFSIYFAATKVTDKALKAAIFANQAGESIQCLITTLKKELFLDYDDLVKAIKDFFVPEKNLVDLKRSFRKLKQMNGESMDTFYMRVCEAARLCEFKDESKEDDELRTEIIIQLVDGARDPRIEAKLEHDKKTTVTDILKFAKTLEYKGISSSSASFFKHETQSNNNHQVHVKSESLNQVKSNRQFNNTAHRKQNSARADTKCGLCGRNQGGIKEVGRISLPSCGQGEIWRGKKTF